MKTTSFSAVGIVGYGNQGRAQALNARDAGFPVHIFVRRGGRSEELARSDGFSPHPIGSDVASMDMIVLLTPDHTHRSVVEEILPYLHSGQAVVFAHGFSVHYQEVCFPDFVDVLLVAPKAVGWAVRESFLNAQGFPCVLAVHQDASGLARKRAEDYATLIGAKPLLWSTFQQETETDLFTEQVLLVGGLMELLMATYDVLAENS
ncbi:MAG: NAD(P)-binding domain-containing protein, partial [bacterium]